MIQRTYRRTGYRKALGQRCRLLKLARDCKPVFESRDRVSKAARVLQRAWRAHVEWMKERQITSAKPLSWTKNIETTAEIVDIWLP